MSTIKSVKEVLMPVSVKRKSPGNIADLPEKITCSESWHKKQQQEQNKIFQRLSGDKIAFIQYYQNLVKESPTSGSYIMLGDAYLKLFKVDKALECFENALLGNPTDEFLISISGKALIDTHHCSRAVLFYQEHPRGSKDRGLQLAELYLNLNQYQKAELMLLELQEDDSETQDELADLKNKIKLLTLLSKTQKETENYTYAIKNLKEAMDTQKKYIRTLKDNSAEVTEAEQKLVIDMILELGEMAIVADKNELAVSLYMESIQKYPCNVDILLGLSKAHLQADELDLCQQISLTIINLDKDNAVAPIHLIDVAIKQLDFEEAADRCKQVLSKQPTNWEVLTRLIDMFRRLGLLENTNQYLATANRHCNNLQRVSRQLYCTALYQWRSGDTSSAFKTFSSIKHNIDVGINSIYNMIEICLDLENIVVGHSADKNRSDCIDMRLDTADTLIKELKVKFCPNANKILKYRILENYLLLFSRDKFNLEKALDDLLSLGQQGNVCIVLGIAIALTLLKQDKRAKNHLKLIAQSDWTIENAEYLERGWLLLGDYYIQGGKYEIAYKLLNKVLQYNKSSAKANELMGFICEKEQNYKEAVLHYNKVWNLGGKRNPSLGLKLAHCYMKTEKYPDAIIVGREVLKMCPNCDVIRTEILEKSFHNLRI